MINVPLEVWFEWLFTLLCPWTLMGSDIWVFTVGLFSSVKEVSCQCRSWCRLSWGTLVSENLTNPFRKIHNWLKLTFVGKSFFSCHCQRVVLVAALLHLVGYFAEGWWQVGEIRLRKRVGGMEIGFWMTAWGFDKVEGFDRGCWEIGLFCYLIWSWVSLRRCLSFFIRIFIYLPCSRRLWTVIRL